MAGRGQTSNKGSEASRYILATKNILASDEVELYELASFAGIVADPKVFKIIVDLLRLNVAPTAIDRMLKSMSVQQRKAHSQEGGNDGQAQATASAVTLPRGRASGIRKPSQR